MLTSPAETGAVTLAMPQDVQAEAYDFPEALFPRRVWLIARPRPRRLVAARGGAASRSRSRSSSPAAAWVYSEASQALPRSPRDRHPRRRNACRQGRAVCSDYPQALGAMGVTGTPGANRLAREADVVVVVGSRLSDFTTASKTAFQHPGA